MFMVMGVIVEHDKNNGNITNLESIIYYLSYNNYYTKRSNNMTRISITLLDELLKEFDNF